MKIQHRQGCNPFKRPEPPTPPPTDPPEEMNPPVNRERLVEEFLDLVQVRGESYNERLIADAIKEDLAEMGLEAVEDDAGSKIGGNTGNLLVNIEGNVEGAPSLLFAAHMDTVRLAVGVKPQVTDTEITSDGTTALGGDNRAGVAEILEAVREVKESNLPHGDIQLLFTVAEEAGLRGARALDPAVLTADYGFAVDVFAANEIYTQGTGLLANPVTEADFTEEGVHAAKEAARHAPIIPPERLNLSPEQTEIMNFTGDAMQDIGLEPTFRAIEWAGTDAIALRRHGMNAISIGAGENRPHTRSEKVVIDDLVASTSLIRSLIANAAAAGAAAGGPVGVALAANAEA